MNIDDCAGDPCKPGMCVDAVNGYTCKCPAGFLGNGGTQCREACPTDACKPGGKCIDGIDGWTCSCELEDDDPRACPDVLMGTEIYDSQTMRTWLFGCLFTMKPNPPNAESAQGAMFHCQNEGGYRWASTTEVETQPARLAAYRPELCAYTPQGFYCGPKADRNAAEVKVYCLR